MHVCVSAYACRRYNPTDPTAKRFRVKPAVAAVQHMVARVRFVADIRQIHKLIDDSAYPLLPLLRAAFVNVRTATVTGARDLVLTYLPQCVSSVGCLT